MNRDLRREIQRLSRRALHIFGAVEIGMPLLGLLAGLFTHTTTERAIEQFLVLGFLCLGTATLAVARTKVGTRHARPMSLLSGFLSAALLIWSEYLTAPNLREAAYLSYKDLMLVMVVAVAAIPARPLHIFSLGCSIVVLSLGSAQLAVQRNLMAGDSMQRTGPTGKRCAPSVDSCSRRIQPRLGCLPPH